MLWFYLYLPGRTKGLFGRAFFFFKYIFLKDWKYQNSLTLRGTWQKWYIFSKAGLFFPLFKTTLLPPESRTHINPTRNPTGSFTFGSFISHFLLITKYSFTACDFGWIAGRLDRDCDCKRTQEQGGRKPSQKAGFPLY